MTRLPATERRQQILAAAREVFLRVGPEAARISDIAAQAEVNVALIYRHFDSKEQLFTEAIIDPLNQMLAEITVDSDYLASVSPEVALTTYFSQMLRVFAATTESFGIALFSDRDNGMAFYTDHITPFLDQLVLKGRVVERSWSVLLDPARTTPMHVGMCWGVAMDAHFRGVALDIDAWAQDMARLTIDGLFTTRAR